MSRTLLIGHPGVSWKEWVRDNRDGQDLLNLDPLDPEQEPPGRLTLRKGSRLSKWTFYGSLDSNRAPHVLVAGLIDLLRFAGDELWVQAPAYRPSPLARQTLQLIAQIVQPDAILIAKGTALDAHGFPVGPEEIEVPEAHPSMILNAQRKGHWLKMIDQCDDHEVDLDKVVLSGTRLGSGRRLQRPELNLSGLGDVLYGEVCGNALLVVTKLEPEEEDLVRAQDIFGAQRAILCPHDAFDGLLCAFSRQDGEDFGIGIIESINFETRVAKVLSTAIAPAPVKILRLGSLRLDTAGREMGETKPWQV